MEPGEQVVDVARAEPAEEDDLDTENGGDAETTSETLISEFEDDEEPGQS
jgi:hypothetical protein